MVSLILWSKLAVAADFQKSTAIVQTWNGQMHEFQVEMAVTPEQHAKGLMHRSNLAPNAGMLFDFHRTQPITMWMKNTLIPLDMLFIESDGRIRTIVERTVPLSTATISSGGAVRAVLELPGGSVARLGLRVGDTLRQPVFDTP